jgi:hypothetical protein
MRRIPHFLFGAGQLSTARWRAGTATRTTVTRLVEPSSIPRLPPRPREPTISSRTPVAAASSQSLQSCNATSGASHRAAAMIQTRVGADRGVRAGGALGRRDRYRGPTIGLPVLVFSGTACVAGSAVAHAIGQHTEISRIAALTGRVERDKSAGVSGPSGDLAPRLRRGRHRRGVPATGNASRSHAERCRTRSQSPTRRRTGSSPHSDPRAIAAVTLTSGHEAK